MKIITVLAAATTAAVAAPTNNLHTSLRSSDDKPNELFSTFQSSSQQHRALRSQRTDPERRARVETADIANTLPHHQHELRDDDGESQKTSEEGLPNLEQVSSATEGKKTRNNGGFHYVDSSFDGLYFGGHRPVRDSSDLDPTLLPTLAPTFSPLQDTNIP